MKNNTDDILKNKKPYYSPNRIILSKDEGGQIRIVLENVTLNQPQDGTTLVDSFNIALQKGDHFILTGPSGSGKSQLIRAIRGLVDKGAGSITIPADVNILCLSQKVDLPRTSLKDILSGQKEPSEAEIDDALHTVGHDRLRKLLPINQAKPDYILSLAKKHISKAIQHWENKILSFDQKTTSLLTRQIESYIQENIQNFFPSNLSAHFTTKTKADVSRRIKSTFENEIEKQKKSTYGTPSNNFWFSAFSEKLAQQVSRYILQGVAMDLKEYDIDGSILSRQLSGGEQQRLMFAKILLEKPDILIMDESTSALDRASGKALYEKVVETLPDTIIWSVAHDTNLIECHNIHGDLDGETKQISVRRLSGPQ